MEARKTDEKPISPVVLEQHELNLAAFASDVAEFFFEPTGTMEYDDFIEIALKHGVVRKVKYDPEVHQNGDDWDAKEGQDWYETVGMKVSP